MNEQLIVKNFGPIKDATVDFKRVTVFIGPTGGGKSTLAKLATLLKSASLSIKIDNSIDAIASLSAYGLANFCKEESKVSWHNKDRIFDLLPESKFNLITAHNENLSEEYISNMLDEVLLTSSQEEKFKFIFQDNNSKEEIKNIILPKIREAIFEKFQEYIFHKKTIYIPSERIFLSSLEYSWPGMMRDDIGLPKIILDFANYFSLARKEVSELLIQFLGVYYVHLEGRDFIRLNLNERPLMLLEAASGIQSVTPLMVLIEYFTINYLEVLGFVVEEPELNLYPTAQQGLLNWLVEKCTKGENDLTITTHSPYLLAHFNTLLFAYQVAQNHPERADEIAKVVPRESWINPAEFAAYHVEGQQENGVRSIVNSETGLISYNGLDAIASAEATEFEKLLDINAGLSVEW